MPMVAQPTAIVGTIQGIEGYEVHPNQKSPIGKRAASKQAKYSLASADFGRTPK